MRFHFPNGDGSYSCVLHVPGETIVRWDPRVETTEPWQYHQETDIENSLKTGERAVTILPPLRRLLEAYLPTLRGRWLVPTPKGGRWNDDAFAKKLRKINGEAGLAWTALHFRHTYATQRAAQGWSLLRISHEMGNSVAIVAKYYAAYTRPVEIGAPDGAQELRIVHRGAA